jgi:hypothetical protein
MTVTGKIQKFKIRDEMKDELGLQKARRHKSKPFGATMILESQLNPRSADFQANAAAMRAWSTTCAPRSSAWPRAAARPRAPSTWRAASCCRASA